MIICEGVHCVEPDRAGRRATKKITDFPVIIPIVAEVLKAFCETSLWRRWSGNEDCDSRSPALSAKLIIAGRRLDFELVHGIANYLHISATQCRRYIRVGIGEPMDGHFPAHPGNMLTRIRTNLNPHRRRVPMEGSLDPGMEGWRGIRRQGSFLLGGCWIQMSFVDGDFRLLNDSPFKPCTWL